MSRSLKKPANGLFGPRIEHRSFFSTVQHTPARPGKIPVTGPPLVIAWGNGPGVILAKSRTGKHLGDGRWEKVR
jgi:hypothetical protein